VVEEAQLSESGPVDLGPVEAVSLPSVVDDTDAVAEVVEPTSAEDERVAPEPVAAAPEAVVAEVKPTPEPPVEVSPAVAEAVPVSPAVEVIEPAPEPPVEVVESAPEPPVEAPVVAAQQPSAVDPAVGCDEGDPVACYRLAREQAADRLVRRSVPRRTLQRGCTDEASHPEACFLLAVYQEGGVGGDRDRTDAVRSFGRACVGGHAESCNRRATLLHAGVGVRRDDRKALRDFESACALGIPDACVSGGALLVRGTFVKKDPERASELFTIACDDGEQAGCASVGALHEDDDPARSRADYERGVALGSTESMRRLARLLWYGLGGSKDKGEAKVLCRDACVAGDAKACRGPAMQ
jgi:hypothetical protein